MPERVSSFTYKHILDHVYGKPVGWKAHRLSIAGRTTLVKSATSSILVYTMQATDLPISVCNAINKCNRDFIWGDIEHKKKVYLVNWNKVWKPKATGGLGVQSLK